MAVNMSCILQWYATEAENNQEPLHHNKRLASVEANCIPTGAAKYSPVAAIQRLAPCNSGYIAGRQVDAPYCALRSQRFQWQVRNKCGRRIITEIAQNMIPQHKLTSSGGRVHPTGPGVQHKDWQLGVLKSSKALSESCSEAVFGAKLNNLQHRHLLPGRR